jgi:hypothetical protein
MAGRQSVASQSETSGMAGCDGRTQDSLGEIECAMRAGLESLRDGDAALCAALFQGQTQCLRRVVYHKRLLEDSESQARSTLAFDEELAADSLFGLFALEKTL